MPSAQAPVPGEVLQTTPLLALLTVAIVLAGAGLVGLDRRDIG